MGDTGRVGVSERARMTALGLLAGVAIDQVAGDPRRGHPVAAFGAIAGRLEAVMWRDKRRAGVAYTSVLVGVGRRARPGRLAAWPVAASARPEGCRVPCAAARGATGRGRAVAGGRYRRGDVGGARRADAGG